ncbi:hypothetical protein OG884_15840 [Streptosporangium sp. NBC_01755]|uniref:hypothetical protein n=1 Tax=unclassified Streptosporangium TaxID=2632669 RepID=UPI002DD7EE6F|nr:MULTISPECIES: hypothetical protein [unclassified Streptosporangium]WSA25380.1 hypothetical protein OIE13_31395 [Streptosporangium sp. NBC_01810]WSD03304.1 hypothetical protein OG884_15840 [Streptosporangium sp. NBC_01755]
MALSVDDTIPDRADRMARFAAGTRWGVRQALAIGGLLAAAWLLAIVFGFLNATPAVADATAETGVARSQTLDTAASGSVSNPDDFPTGSGKPSATDNAEAMAGRGVDGLTSQSKPGVPAPATVDHGSGANGFVPQSGGGSGLFGSGPGDVAWFAYDPRLTTQRAPLAFVLPPVVRTAADDPSFSPD